MDRKPIFDAVRGVLGRGFSHAEVEALDQAIDKAIGARPTPQLGELSRRFESGERGSGAVSAGRGDPGGVSYGIWQLSSRAGTVAAFLIAEGSRWKGEFGRAPPGSAEFSGLWRSIADRDDGAFAEAQRVFVERTHYRPAVAEVLRETGMDLDVRHPAVRDATWSVAVQHGAGARILTAAVSTAPSGDDRALLHAIYAERSRYVLRVAARSGEGARHTLEAVVRSRYPAELAAALQMLEGEGNSPPDTAQASACLAPTAR
jgi:hypothetical protein